MNAKLPPQARDLEQAVLGAILIESKAIDEISGVITSNDFYDPRHGYIYDAVFKLHDTNQPIDMLTVKNELQKMGALEESGGALYLSELTNKVASAAHIKKHASIIIEKSKQRQLIQICTETIDNCYNDTGDFEKTLESINTACIQLDKGTGQDEIIHISKSIDKKVKRLELIQQGDRDLLGISTGFQNFDNVITCLEPGRVYLGAGRPGMGKSAFVQSIAMNVAKLKKGVGIISLEMTDEQQAARMMSSESGIPQQAIKSAEIKNWSKFIDATSRLYELPIYFNTSVTNLVKLKSIVRRMVVEMKVEVLIIDYLQLISNEGKNQNREQEISKISRAIKQMALAFDIPVISLSQLSRAVEARGDKRPKLSDLRESGSLEQDADVVFFLYRPEYYGIKEDENGNSTEGLAEVIVDKNRDGECKTFYVQFEGQYARFKDYEGEMNFEDAWENPNTDETPF